MATAATAAAMCIAAVVAVFAAGRVPRAGAAFLCVERCSDARSNERPAAEGVLAGAFVVVAVGWVVVAAAAVVAVAAIRCGFHCIRAQTQGIRVSLLGDLFQVAAVVSGDSPVVISKFISNAKEVCLS